MYNLDRSPEEIAHNTLIKDTIRDKNIAHDLVVFLCNSALSIRESNVNLSKKCFRALAELIGWIDLSLILQTPALSIIYNAMTDVTLLNAACGCILEIVKKGMDPVSKTKMLQSIGVINVLENVPLDTAPSDEVIGGNSGEDDEREDDADEECSPAEALAPVLDAAVLELIECYSIYEDSLFAAGTGQQTQISPAELQGVAQQAVDLLRACMPLMFRVFTFSSAAATSLFPSFNRLVVLLKCQSQPSRSSVLSLRAGGSSAVSFIVLDYLKDILTAICQRMEFPSDFEFDGEDEDDVEEMEVSTTV